MDNYTGHRKVFSCGLEVRNCVENVSDIVQCFELFLTKKLYNKLSEKLTGTQNNTRMPKAIFSHLDHLWGHGHLSQKMKFTQF
jgi:hypothetical protein